MLDATAAAAEAAFAPPPPPPPRLARILRCTRLSDLTACAPGRGPAPTAVDDTAADMVLTLARSFRLSMELDDWSSSGVGNVDTDAMDGAPARIFLANREFIGCAAATATAPGLGRTAAGATTTVVAAEGSTMVGSSIVGMSTMAAAFRLDIDLIDRLPLPAG